MLITAGQPQLFQGWRSSISLKVLKPIKTAQYEVPDLGLNTTATSQYHMVTIELHGILFLIFGIYYSFLHEPSWAKTRNTKQGYLIHATDFFCGISFKPPNANLRLLLNRQEQLELRRQLLLGIETIGEVDAADTTVCVDLNAKGLDVVRAVGAAGEVREVELDLEGWMLDCCEGKEASRKGGVRTWFQPSSKRMGMVQMKGFTRVVDCVVERRGICR